MALSICIAFNAEVGQREHRDAHGFKRAQQAHRVINRWGSQLDPIVVPITNFSPPFRISLSFRIDYIPKTFAQINPIIHRM